MTINFTDGIYTTLELQLRDKYLTSLNFMAATYPHCFVKQDFVNEVEEGSVDRFYFTDTLKLAAITLDNREYLLGALKFSILDRFVCQIKVMLK